MLNCQQATYLLERTAGQPQRVGSLMPLRVHLRLCSLCSRYQVQSLLIARVARPLADPSPVRLREEFKAQVRARIQALLTTPPPPAVG